MKYFVGLDVALRSLALCIIDADGTVVLERALDCEVEAITACLAEFGHHIEKIGFEAGTMSQALYHGLTTEGFDVVCMEARQVYAALSAMRNKTDKNDARGIAQVLRSGWYNKVHIKSFDAHYDRALLTARKAIFRKCLDLEAEIRGLFKVFGIRLPGHVKRNRWDETVRPFVEADERLAFALKPMLEARLVLYKTYLEMEKRLRAVTNKDPVCMRLQTIPGVGPVAALTFKTGVDDPTRFKSSRIVAAHFGLTPRRFQSGEMDNTGRISKAGDSSVRGALYSAANVLLMRMIKSCELKSWGLRLVRKKGRKRATVAVARKLAVIMHRIWVDGTTFRWDDQEAVMT